MISKKILILATYPIADPLHGGQKRTKAIVEFYKGIFKQVKFVAVFSRKDFKICGPDDIAISDDSIVKEIEISPFAGDIIIGERLYDDLSAKQMLLQILDTYNPDVIQIEQVFLYASLRKICQERQQKTVIIFSSHNNETAMKKQIYADLGLPKTERHELEGKIANLERTFSREAKFVVAVSEPDAQWHKKIGAKKCIIAPNGIEKVIPTVAALNHWRKYKKDNNLKQLVTFVGSAHPPNLKGLKQMVGQETSFMPEQARLMLAGGISQYLQETYKPGSPAAKAFWKKAAPLGNLSDDNLVGLIHESEVLLLPIVSGGGSNLKTAEAILSGKKIVATSFAFRSFEKYAELPNIRIADAEEGFKQQIIEALKSPYVERTPKQIDLAEHTQWKYCLSPLTKYLPIYIDGRLKTVARRLKNAMARLILKAIRSS